MSRITQLLSRRPSADAIKQNLTRDPDVMAIDDEAADAVFSALSSGTSRAILTALYDKPRTASEIADAVDTSLQNVNYHLNKLHDGGLIEVVQTWYSDQGKEMKVYAPANEALVLFAGDDLHRSSLLDAIKRLVGFVGIFAVVSVIVDRVTRPVSPSVTLKVGSTGTGEGSTTVVFPPGLLFFLGSLFALLVFATWWYYRSL